MKNLIWHVKAELAFARFVVTLMREAVRALRA